MDRNEWLEAEAVLTRLLDKIDGVLIELDKAKSWGIWDIFGGGGISGIIKREKIKNANQKLEQLRFDIMDVEKELADVNFSLANVPDTPTDFMLDVVFDNIFTDLRVQDEVKATYNEVARLKEEVVTVLSKVRTNL